MTIFRTLLAAGRLWSLLAALCVTTAAHGQLAEKLQQAAQKARKTAKDLQDAARQIDATSREVSGTVKGFQKTWAKNPAKNIQYKQVPDYRTRQEVPVSRKQKLAVENGEFVNINWQPVTKFDNQVFPSFIIGWASYQGIKEQDMGSSLGFAIRTTMSNVVLKWEIEASDKSYFALDSGYINCDELRRVESFMPKINWNYRALVKHDANAPLNIRFRLIDPNSGKKVEKLASVTLRSINDCLVAYNGQEFNYMFASYVNEDHPEIDRILKQMLNTKMIDAVLGYQSNGMYVDLQVAALWRVLHERGFKYSSITGNSGYNRGQGLFAQTVRTFDNAIKTSQANCVDGTAVFASVLKRIGIRPIIVTAPGHCFLGYYTSGDTARADIKFVETTMLSDNTYTANQKAMVAKYGQKVASALPPGVKLSEQNKAYYLEFLAAQIGGMAAYEEKTKKYGNDAVKMFDVSWWRRYIKPIPVYN